jgi:hypothetical protein
MERRDLINIKDILIVLGTKGFLNNKMKILDLFHLLLLQLMQHNLEQLNKNNVININLI